MEKILSKAEVNALSAKGIKVVERLGSGASGNVFAIEPYKGIDGLCMKYFYNYPRKSVDKEYERCRKLYYTEPAVFCRMYDLVWIEVPDEQLPDQKHYAAAMIMERLKPIDLTNQSLNSIIKILFESLVCIAYMHVVGILHRDPKPENILYCERTGTYVLMDYGISRECNGTFKEKSCSGTLYYIAPESLRGVFSKRSDLYADGMAFREMLCGKEFEMPEDGEINVIIDKLYQTKKALKPLNETKFECPELIRILNRMTCFDREERYPDCFAAIKDVVALIRNSENVEITKEKHPADMVMLVAVNELNKKGMSLSEVSGLVRKGILHRTNDSVRIAAFPVSDSLYVTTNKNGAEELYTPEESSPFLKELRAQIEKIVDSYKSCGFRPHIKLCIAGVSNKSAKYNGFLFHRKALGVCNVEQILTGDTLVDFGAMGIDSVVLVNQPEEFRQFLSGHPASDSLNKE